MLEGEPKNWDNSCCNGRIRSVDTTVNGRRATEGEIDPGAYTVPVGAEEHITITNGNLDAKHGRDAEYTTYGPGQSFVAPAHSLLWLRCGEPVSYQCVYFEADGQGGYGA